MPTVPLVARESITPDPPAWSSRTVLRQRWAELAYFHWRYDPAVVQALLPDRLRVDTFDGSAWVGLIPFEMQRVRIGPLPPLPTVSTFVEVNVRTYVVDDRGRRAVWFFSLDVPFASVVAVARTVFSLPYCLARAEHVVDEDRHRYRVRRRWPRTERGSADLAFSIGASIEPEDVDDLDHFLTARWALVAAGRSGRLRRGEVDHVRWPLHDVHDVDLSSDLFEAAGLPAPIGEPRARYSPGVDVRVSRFEPLERGAA